MSEAKSNEIRAGASSKEIRQARVRGLLRRLGIWVVIPSLLGVIYYGFLAAPQYDSVSVIRVAAREGESAKTPEAESLLVKEFAESRAMLDVLVAESEFKEHYSSGGDFITRLSADAGAEKAFEYFRDKVSLVYLSKSRTIRVTVRAFSGEAAQSFATAIVKAAEQMTNATEDKAREARLALAIEREAAAESHVQVTQLALSTLQSVQGGEGEQERSAQDAADLEMARYKRDLARSAYESVIVEHAKVVEERVQGQRYISVISPPSVSDGAAHPRRGWGILTVFVLSLVLMGVFSMLGAAVKEHARF